MSLRSLKRLAGNLGGRYALAIIEASLTSLADWRFDRRYATETKQQIDLDKLDVASENKARGRKYEPTQSRPFRLLLQSLKLSKENTFIDFGCGKGRALLLAAEYGFANIVGVEFAQELCDVAGRNVELYNARSHTKSKISVLHMDATQYPIAAHESVFYMYNPFNDEIMATVIANILKSATDYPRQVFVTYLNPLCRQVIERTGKFELVANPLFHRSRFMVYSNLPLVGKRCATCK